ncbi:PREDICTED: solute carrier family 22 member 15-like isoform X1 [Acropora digitifera]|uniref:solute carrier family 22 member 15-like isoform X1 n=1 Tax=Acropora digitifera TaxID=70779 RepID=UPI00077A14BB|nr:PREDICTED: solute carrier family 22 member 15-like isoform X1 [Acropora digitifera]
MFSRHVYGGADISFSSRMGLTADQVFDKIGSFSRFQLLILFLFNILGWFWFGWPVLLMTFIAAEPKWRCINRGKAIFNDISVSNASAVINASGSLNGSVPTLLCPLNEPVGPGDKDYSLRCEIPRDLWEFEDTFTSVVTQFDLVCDRAIYGTIASSLVFGGWIIGSVVIGSLADKFGRRTMSFLFGFFIALFSLLSAFPNVYWLFAIFRLIVGFSIGSGGMSLFVLLTELAGPKHRSLIGTSLWYSWTSSLIALAGVAYLIRNWRTLCIATGAPAIVVTIIWFWSPESLRWLLVKGKMEEAEKLYRKIARINGKELPETSLEIDSIEVTQTRLGNFRDLFKTRTLAKTTLISWLCWFVNALVYYGVFLSAPSIGGDLYLNFFLASLVELPAIPIGIWIYNRFGRKKGVIIPMILASFGAIGAVLLTTDDESNTGFLVGRIILSMVWAKFWIMISFDGVYIYSSELFPTVIRNLGMGTSTSAAQCGSFLSPYVLYLQRVHPLLPYGIMSALAFVAGILCILLPETRFMPTLENVHQVLNVAAKEADEESDITE